MSDFASSLSHVNGNTAGGARKTQISLPDERRLEIWVQPRLLSSELQDIVASHFNLKEREYFGLSFRDDTGHWLWLQPSHRVLDHDFPKRSGHGFLQLRFGVKFFLEHVHSLHDSNAVELFYLHAQSLVVSGDLECDSESTFRLAAYVLQVKHGDYCDDELTRQHLKKLNAFPIKVLKQHLSLQLCENKVIEFYRDLVGAERGDAVLEYLGIVEKLPTYGMHLYDVKDKSGLPWWLGVSFRGIYQFDYNDKRVPRKYFSWQQLQNLYYRDKKFSIEIHESKRVPALSRRSFITNNLTVSWWAPTTQLTKAMWCMAVAQHQFFIVRKNGSTKSNLDSVAVCGGLPTKPENMMNAQRHRTEVAHELTHRRHSFSKLPSYDERVRILAARSQSSLTSAASLNLSGSERGDSDSCRDLSSLNEHDEVVHLRHRYEQLKARKENRRLQLQEKLNRLKQVCLEEAELTGQLPSEYPRHDGEPLPMFRRRVRTTYAINPLPVNCKDAAAAADVSSCFNSDEHLCGGVNGTVEELLVEESSSSTAATLQYKLEDSAEIVRKFDLELQVQRNKATALRRMHAGARSRRQRKITLAEQLMCEDRVATLERQLRALRHNPLLCDVISLSPLQQQRVIKRISSASSTGQLNIHCGSIDTHSLCSELSLGALSCGGMPRSSQGSLHANMESTGNGVSAAIASAGYVSFQPARGYRATAFPTLLPTGGVKETAASSDSGSALQRSSLLHTTQTIMSTQSADSGFVEGSKPPPRLLHRTKSGVHAESASCIKQLLRRSVSDPHLPLAADNNSCSSSASSPGDYDPLVLVNNMYSNSSHLHSETEGYSCYSTVAATLCCMAPDFGVQRYSLGSTDCSNVSASSDKDFIQPPNSLANPAHDRNSSTRRINSTSSLPSNMYLVRSSNHNDLDDENKSTNCIRQKIMSDSDTTSGSLASDFSREMLNWIEKKDCFSGTDA